MEFGASIRPARDADLGEQQLARKLPGRARVGDHEHGHAGLILMPKQRPQPASLDVGRGEGFGEETDADAENGEPLRFVEMLGQSGNLKAKTMTRAIGSELVRLVGAGEHEGLARERGRVGEGLAIKRMRLAAIDAVRLIEQEVVGEIGAKGLRRGDADIDLVAQKRCGNRIPGGDVDQDLNLGMPVVEARDGRSRSVRTPGWK